MKRKWYIAPAVFLCVIFFLMICLECTVPDGDGCIQQLKLVWPSASGYEKISLFERDGVLYGFLPSYADTGRVSLQSEFGIRVFIDGLRYEKTPLETDREYSLSVRDLRGSELVSKPLVLMQGENIPAISIRLTDGSPEELSQKKELRAAMTVTEPDGSVAFRSSVEKFHVRGNYTSTLPKTSYTLKFKKDVDLLDTGAYDTYCLIANTDDESRMRNKLVYETAQEVGLAYSPESRYADLYIDGVYYGLYLLTEKIDVAPSRINLTQLQEQTEAVNYRDLSSFPIWFSEENGLFRKSVAIPSNPGDITGGYLLELEVEDRLWLNDNAFVTESGQPVSVKYPAQCSIEQLCYIADYYQEMEDSLSDGTYARYIDVASWAKFYLVQEFFSQIDITSVFFYKDSDSVDPKIYAGPVWDFDWSLGLGGGFFGEEISVSPYQFQKMAWGPFKALNEDEAFQETLKEVYETEFRPVITRFLPEALDTYEQQISASHAMDAMRWEGDYISPYGVHTGSLAGSADWMRTWIEQRLDCFDSFFMDDSGLVYVTLLPNCEEMYQEFWCYAKNGRLVYPPKNLEREGYTFAGWYTQDGQPVDLEKPLTQNIVLEARWEAAVPETPSGTEPAPEGMDSPAPADSRSILDGGILLCLAVLCLYVFLRPASDILRQIVKKRKKHEDRTSVPS
ncbi:MAG: CotH kinase family protein [Faecousia sp.]